MPYDDEALTDRIYREAVPFLETDGKFPRRDQVESILYRDLLDVNCSLEMVDRCYHRAAILWCQCAATIESVLKKQEATE
jgi:hypothetical protein